MDFTVSAGGMEHLTAPGTPDRRSASGTYSPTCGICDGWKPTIRKKSPN